MLFLEIVTLLPLYVYYCYCYCYCYRHCYHSYDYYYFIIINIIITTQVFFGEPVPWPDADTISRLRRPLHDIVKRAPNRKSCGDTAPDNIDVGFDGGVPPKDSGASGSSDDEVGEGQIRGGDGGGAPAHVALHAPAEHAVQAMRLPKNSRKREVSAAHQRGSGKCARQGVLADEQPPVAAPASAVLTPSMRAALGRLFSNAPALP